MIKPSRYFSEEKTTESSANQHPFNFVLMLPGHLTKNFPSDIYVGSQNRKNTGNNHPTDKKSSGLHVQSSSQMVTLGAVQVLYRKSQILT